MNAKDYNNYVVLANRMGWPVYPNDFGTSPRVFGLSYLGSRRKRKNDIQRRRFLKHHKQ